MESAVGFHPCLPRYRHRRGGTQSQPDGNPAPVHLLDGLPDEWIVERGEADQVLAIKPTVITGLCSTPVSMRRARVRGINWQHLFSLTIRAERPLTCLLQRVTIPRWRRGYGKISVHGTIMRTKFLFMALSCVLQATILRAMSLPIRKTDINGERNCKFVPGHRYTHYESKAVNRVRNQPGIHRLNSYPFAAVQYQKDDASRN